MANIPTSKANAAHRARKFVDAIVNLAIHDADDGIAARHPLNTGQQLVIRAQTSHIRRSPRAGDSDEARRIYTAVRFIYSTEPDNAQE